MSKILIFFLLLDLQGKVAINKSLWLHNSFLDFFKYSSDLAPLKNKNKISIKQVKSLQKNFLHLFFFFFLVVYFCFVIVWSDFEV